MTDHVMNISLIGIGNSLKRIADAVDRHSNTCATCKHYVTEYSWAECTNEALRKMVKVDYSGGATFEFTPDFGCNQWSGK